MGGLVVTGIACSPQVGNNPWYLPPPHADAGTPSPSPTGGAASLPPLPTVGFSDGGVAIGDSGYFVPTDSGVPAIGVPGLPGPDGGLAVDAGGPNGTIFFAGGAPATLTASPTDPAFLCAEGSGRCIEMIKYWPAPALGTMLVKSWDFMAAPQLGDYRAAQQNLRTQAFLHLGGSPANEYALTEHFSGPTWTFATWQDTWHFRYEGNAVIEFKDDVNLSTTVLPRLPGVQLSRMVYAPGQELRWGARLASDVLVPSPSHAVTTDLAPSSLTPVRTFDMFAANVFSLVDVRDGVIANGTRYDKVAVVRVDQRTCRPNTSCSYDPAGTADYVISYFYLAVGVGPIVTVTYWAVRDQSDDLVFDGNFAFELGFGEVATKVCTQPLPTPAPLFDHQLAMTDKLTGSPAPPSCP